MTPTIIPAPTGAAAPSTQAPVPAAAPPATPFREPSASAPVPALAPASAPAQAPAAVQPSLQQDKQETNGELKDMLQKLLWQLKQMMFMIQQSQFQERFFTLLLDQQQHQLQMGLGNGQAINVSK
ncbi:cyclin-dependent kinase inhibitor 1C-like [Penaeus vannamei]|uniref:cyclin-dependent kinase inhibitor 1C-like n=1 Tax=Penaeus vannamei TaxID=6689 RepID=UPI00387F6EE9